jgi:DNA-binding HxlR family transcriptional regulator
MLVSILADRLSMLEVAGLLVKEEHPDSKAKYFYRLTNQGIDLLPVLVELILWSDKYLPISRQAKEFAKQLRKNKDGLIKQISSGLKKA